MHSVVRDKSQEASTAVQTAEMQAATLELQYNETVRQTNMRRFCSRQPQSGSLERRRMTVVRYERPRIPRSSCFRLKDLALVSAACLSRVPPRLRQSAPTITLWHRQCKHSNRSRCSQGTMLINTNLLQRAVVLNKAQSIKLFYKLLAELNCT